MFPFATSDVSSGYNKPSLLAILGLMFSPEYKEIAHPGSILPVCQEEAQVSGTGMQQMAWQPQPLIDSNSPALLATKERSHMQAVRECGVLGMNGYRRYMGGWVRPSPSQPGLPVTPAHKADPRAPATTPEEAACHVP